MKTPLEKGMATHSSILAWRIRWTREAWRPTVLGVTKIRTQLSGWIEIETKWKWSRSVVSDSSRPHGLQPTRLLRPWDFPGKSGVPLPSPGDLPDPGIEPGFSRIVGSRFYRLSHQGSPVTELQPFKEVAFSKCKDCDWITTIQKSCI